LQNATLEAALVVNKVLAEARERDPFGISRDARGLDAVKLVEGWFGGGLARVWNGGRKGDEI
jgi:hypothetical protein